MELKASSVDQYKDLAKQIIDHYSDERVFLLHGMMGVGKTTLTKGFIEVIGSEDEGCSPTFGIVNEYETSNGSIYHFDCYRMKDSEEALAMGWDDYLYSGNYCFIEWPERVEDILPDSFVIVRIENVDGERIIKTESHH